MICAALWPDPADELCPVSFRDKVRSEMLAWTPHERQRLLSEESRKRLEKARQTPALFDDAKQLRGALLDFIADFANWDNSAVKEYLETSRAPTQSAHEALGGVIKNGKVSGRRISEPKAVGWRVLGAEHKA